MHRFLLSFLPLAVAFSSSALAAQPSAREALKLLPAGAESRLAMVEGRDGTPNPQRWHFLVQDPQSANGLKEYVTAGSSLVAVRELSQFAEQLSPSQIVGADAMQMNSDELALLARQYASETGKTAAAFNYELVKDNANGSAVWKIECLDAASARIGRLTVSAEKGTVLSQEGFASQPTVAAAPYTPPPVNAESGQLAPPPIAENTTVDPGAAPVPTRKIKHTRAVQPPITTIDPYADDQLPPPIYVDRDRGYVVEADPEEPTRRRTETRSVRVVRRTLPPPITTVRRIIHGLLPF